LLFGKAEKAVCNCLSRERMTPANGAGIAKPKLNNAYQVTIEGTTFVNK